MNTRSLKCLEKPNKPKAENGQTVTCNQAPQSSVFTWGAQDQCRAGRVDIDFKDKKSTIVAEGWLAAEGSLMKLPKDPRSWFPFNSAL